MFELTFFDNLSTPSQLYPLTYTRPAAKLLIGINTIEAKWLARLPKPALITYLSAAYLHSKFPRPKASHLYINGHLLPYTPKLIDLILNLKPNEALYYSSICLAYHSQQVLNSLEELKILLKQSKKQAYLDVPKLIESPLDLFKFNRMAIKADFDYLKQKRKSNPIPDKHTICYGKEYIFIEQGVQMYNSTLIASSDKPIYIGKHAVVEAGCTIQGAFALGENAQLNMGTKIRGDSSIGRNCKVGGEISNSIIHAYTNKGHAGFLGNSVLGEWCNLGAGTIISNLKNNYSFVKIWDFEKSALRTTNEQFCGLLMGDHSKASIGTRFNTGTTIGVGANIFGVGFPPKYIPNFTWGGYDKQVFKFDKFYEMAERMMQRRNLKLEVGEHQILRYLYDQIVS